MDIRERFWSKVDKTPGYGPWGDCWEWTATTGKGGYGRVRVDGRLHQAHRVAYELEKGPIPEGLVICHRCDNRRCVNPDHLFPGTMLDNAADIDAKGRGRFLKGEEHGQSKLSADDVLRLRRMYANGDYSQRRLAAEFGVSQSTVRDIVQRKWWTHI